MRYITFNPRNETALMIKALLQLRQFRRAQVVTHQPLKPVPTASRRRRPRRAGEVTMSSRGKDVAMATTSAAGKGKGPDGEGLLRGRD